MRATLVGSETDARFVNVRRFFSLISLGLALAVTGCAGAPPQPAKPRPIDPETRLERPRRHHDELPPIQAPPPAYGNKIVMAERYGIRHL